MRVFAHHDDKGTLHGLVAFEGPKDAWMMLGGQPGELITEMEGVKLKSPLDPEALHQLATSHTLANYSRGKLVKRAT